MRAWLLQIDRSQDTGRILSFDEATALQHNALLATRNVDDFRGTGVAILNPWEG